MIHLTYETNKELLNEMQRILPEFKVDPIFTTDLDHWALLLPNDEQKIVHRGSTVSDIMIPLVTPSDVVRFLQDERVMLNYRKMDNGVYRTSNTATIFELVINWWIFRSSENFEKGVKELLLPELKRIK